MEYYRHIKVSPTEQYYVVDKNYVAMVRVDKQGNQIHAEQGVNGDYFKNKAAYKAIKEEDTKPKKTSSNKTASKSKETDE